MAPELENNGWQEHRKLVEWRLAQNEHQITQLRKDNDASHGAISTQLNQIQTTLSEIQGARKLKITALNLAIPALVSLLVLAGEYALAHILR